MNCKNIREHFSDYADGNMDQAKMLLFDKHIEACSQCRRDFEKYNATIMMLEELPEVELPNTFHYSVMNRLEEERMKAPRRVNWLKLAWQSIFSVQNPGKAFAMGAAAMFIAFGLVLATPSLNTITSNFIAPSNIDAPTGPDNKGQTVDAWDPAGSGSATNESGLQVSVDRVQSSKGTYEVALATLNGETVTYEITEDGAFAKSGNDSMIINFRGTLKENMQTVVPIKFEGSDNQAWTARINWHFKGNDYSNCLFLPSTLDTLSAESTRTMHIEGKQIYDVLKIISAKYNVVVLASGDLTETLDVFDVKDANAEEALYQLATQAGKSWAKREAGVYILE